MVLHDSGIADALTVHDMTLGTQQEHPSSLSNASAAARTDVRWRLASRRRVTRRSSLPLEVHRRALPHSLAVSRPGALRASVLALRLLRHLLGRLGRLGRLAQDCPFFNKMPRKTFASVTVRTTGARTTRSNKRGASASSRRKAR